MNRLFVNLSIAILAGVFLVSAFSSALMKSATCDEAAHHVPAGYIYLKKHDFAFSPEVPPLPRYLAAAPLVFMDLELPDNRSFWARDDRAVFSREFLYVLNRDHAAKIIFLSRVPMILLGLSGGIFLFLWVRKRYGDLPGVLASLFYFISPNILAHSSLATTDITATVFIMMSVLTFWDYFESADYRTAISAGIVLGLALLSKYSSLLLPVIYFSMVASRLSLVVRKKDLVKYILSFLILATVSGIVLWAGYLFEYKPLFDGALRAEEKAGFIQRLINDPIVSGKVISFLKDVPVPLSSYIMGFLGVIKHGSEGARTFFMGTWSHKGNPFYYIVAFLIKTPVPVIISFICGSIVMFFDDTSKNRKFGVYLLLVISVFIVSASRSDLQLGLRYILPVYPLIFIIASYGLSYFAGNHGFGKYFSILFIIWLFVSNLLIWPHYLSYYNELVGGPENGYKYLRDSNIDWGQDLPFLKDIMLREKIDKVKLDYFGEGDPGLYGITREAIEEPEEKSPLRKVYAISVHYLDRYGWALKRAPDFRAGYSINIYDMRGDHAGNEDR